MSQVWRGKKIALALESIALVTELAKLVSDWNMIISLDNSQNGVFFWKIFKIAIQYDFEKKNQSFTHISETATLQDNQLIRFAEEQWGVKWDMEP